MLGNRLLTLFAPLLVLAACSPKTPPGGGPVEFTRPLAKEGQAIRTTMVTKSEKGSVSSVAPGDSLDGSLIVERKRTFATTATRVENGIPAAATITVADDVLTSIVVTEGASKTDQLKSPLVNVPLVASRSGEKWTVKPTSGAPTPEQRDDLAELELFQNREWIPKRPVQPGDSWEINPGYFNRLIERDLGNAAGTATMTFERIELADDGSRRAHIVVEVDSSGSVEENGRLTAQAMIRASGTLIIDLDTMLEHDFTVSGTLDSASADPSSQAVVGLTFEITLKREFVEP